MEHTTGSVRDEKKVRREGVVGCPHYKRTEGKDECVGTCRAHHDQVMVPSIGEVTFFCLSERYDECEVYLKYIERCTRDKFPKILEDLNLS